MITLFRKIRKQLLTQNKLTRYLVYAVGEIFLVVIGILIALQINNWNEEKKGAAVIVHLMKPEWIKRGIAAPRVMIASDGSSYSKLAHPRTAGTFSKVLGQYVREEQVIDLLTAIEKMTLLPAKRLENLSSMMLFK